MKTWRTGLFLLVALLNAQCSDSSKSSKISIDIVPEQPIVINADFTLVDDSGTPSDTTDDVTTDIVAPWFQFRYLITNNSDETVTIVNFKLKITTFGKDGKLIETEQELDPEDLDQTFLAEITPGDTYGDVASEQPTWFIHGLPDETKVSSFAYRVEFKAVGWFGDSTTPTKSFNRSVTSVTTF